MAMTLACGGVALAVEFQNVDFVNLDAAQRARAEAAIDDWEARLPNPGRIFSNFAVQVVDLGPGILAATDVVRLGGSSDPADYLPWGSHIATVTQLNTQYINEMYFADGPVPADKYDALTILRHEIGHAVGFDDAYDDFSAKLTDDVPNNRRIYNGNGFQYFLTRVGTHLIEPSGDLMTAGLGKNTRRPISDIDVQILTDAYDYVPEPATLSILGAGLLLTIWKKRNYAHERND